MELADLRQDVLQRSNVAQAELLALSECDPELARLAGGVIRDQVVTSRNGDGDRLNTQQANHWRGLCKEAGIPTDEVWFDHAEPVFVGPISARWIDQQISKYHLDGLQQELAESLAGVLAPSAT